MMIDATDTLPAQSVAAPTFSLSALLAVALMSFSALLLELGLTRLFSVVLFYHFAFLAISVALLGLGAGAVFACLRRQWLEKWSVSELGRGLCALNAALIFACSRGGGSHRGFVASFVAELLAADDSLSRLCGSVLHHRAIVLRGVRTALIADHAALRRRSAGRIAGMPGAGTAVEHCRRPERDSVCRGDGGAGRRRVGTAGQALGTRWTGAAVLVLIALNFNGRVVDIVYAKGMKRNPPVYAHWNALSRVEVDNWGTARAIVIDADASTYLMNTDPHHWRDDYRINAMSAAPSVANVLRPHGDFAIIGPGGGVDVLRAVANGSPNVTGIEINPIIANNIMRDRFADYTFHLYQVPEVHMHVSDGRSFIRNSQRQVRRGADDAGGYLGVDRGRRFCA